jgi:hypothetical protein
MALLDNPHSAMYPYHLMNSRLAALGSSGDASQHVSHMNGYVNGRFDMRLGSTTGASSSSNRSSTSPNVRHIDTINEDESSPTHQTVLNATMSLKLESGYHRFGQNRSTTFRPFSSESPDIENNIGDDARRDLKVMKRSFPETVFLKTFHFMLNRVVGLWCQSSFYEFLN